MMDLENIDLSTQQGMNLKPGCPGQEIFSAEASLKLEIKSYADKKGNVCESP